MSEPGDGTQIRPQPAAFPQHDRAAPGAIDIDELAERVYRHMMADLRLERARHAGVDSYPR